MQSCCFCKGAGEQSHAWLVVAALKSAVLGAQLLVQQVPEAIDRVVFLDAVILKTGESFALNQIGWPAQVAPAPRLPLSHYSAPRKEAHAAGCHSECSQKCSCKWE